MDDPNITIEEYIRLEEEKARRRGNGVRVFNEFDLSLRKATPTSCALFSISCSCLPDFDRFLAIFALSIPTQS
ncbi:hypothetical protein Tco_1164606 [Tanacetum coccineum]